MSRGNENSPFDAIETLLDEIRVEEEAQLAVLEALAELDDRGEDEFSWDEFSWDEFPRGELAWDPRRGPFLDECPP